MHRTRRWTFALGLALVLLGSAMRPVAAQQWARPASGPDRVTLLERQYVVDRRPGGAGHLWVSGKLRHTYADDAMIRLEVLVYSPGGRLLGKYHFWEGPVPSGATHSYRRLGLGEEVPAGVQVGRVDVQMVEVVSR